MTRIEGRPHDDLLRVYGFRGFPSLAFLDAEGTKLASPPQRTVASFASTADALTEIKDLRERIAKGDKGLDGKLLVAELKLGQVDYPAAKERFNALKKLDKETKAELASLLVDAEVMHIFASAGNDAEKRAAAYEQCVAMLRAGKIPTGQAESAFWGGVRSWADQHEDAEIYAKALAWYQARYGEDERYARSLENLEKRLAEIREGKKEEPKP